MPKGYVVAPDEDDEDAEEEVAEIEPGFFDYETDTGSSQRLIL